MAMEVHCQVCRQPFEPERIDIVAGVWRLCPGCRRDGRGNPSDGRLPPGPRP